MNKLWDFWLFLCYSLFVCFYTTVNSQKQQYYSFLCHSRMDLQNCNFNPIPSSSQIVDEFRLALVETLKEDLTTFFTLNKFSCRSFQVKASGLVYITYLFLCVRQEH